MDATVEKAQLVKAAEDFLAAAKDFNGDPLARIALMKQADNLRYSSEDPFGTISRTLDAINLKAALAVLISTGVLQKLPTEGSVGSKELADAVDIDESVVQRAMRIICVQGIAEEPTSDHYVHNAKSLAYVTGLTEYFFKMVLDFDETLTQLPQYFKSHKKEDLVDLNKSPYAFSKDSEGKTYYEVVSADPERFEIFNKTLTHMDEAMPILGMFPFASMKAEVEADPQRPFIVDVGGGFGRVMSSILQEAAGGFGAEVILQDRPDVIAAISKESLPNVTLMVHDFFTPQPVKNAHIYLLRRILHDFYEPVCIEIVKHIASAMGPTSRLLIGDFVVPEKTVPGADMMIYWMDMLMMTITGKEKTAKQFEYILDAAGLQLVKIWPFAYGAQAVVEARLKP